MKRCTAESTQEIAGAIQHEPTLPTFGLVGALPIARSKLLQDSQRPVSDRIGRYFDTLFGMMRILQGVALAFQADLGEFDSRCPLRY